MCIPSSRKTLIGGEPINSKTSNSLKCIFLGKFPIRHLSQKPTLFSSILLTCECGEYRECSRSAKPENKNQFTKNFWMARTCLNTSLSLYAIFISHDIRPNKRHKLHTKYLSRRLISGENEKLLWQITKKKEEEI